MLMQVCNTQIAGWMAPCISSTQPRSFKQHSSTPPASAACLLLNLLLQSLGWRTMLVVPELEQELAVGETTHATQFELKMLRNARSDLDTQVSRA